MWEVLNQNTSFQHDDENHVIAPYLEKVIYDIANDMDLKGYAIWLMNSSQVTFTPYEPLLHKRVAFSYENECRAFVTEIDSKTNPVTRITIPKVDSFIESVLVHPGASKQFIGKVRNACFDRRINYSGKSDLYNTDYLTWQ